MPGAPGEGKRAAPISASAFSFSLAKKPKGPPSLPPPPLPPPKPKAKPMSPVAHPAQNPQRPITSHGLVTPTRPKAAPKTTPKPVGPLGPMPSPFGLSPVSARPQKRLTALDDPASPFKKQEERNLQAITAMPRLGVAEVRAAAEVEEGVGVSPRKHKGALHHKGSAPPPSVRLANLVSGNSTSLVLFYTSLQHTLAGRPRAVAQRIASAPVRLRVTRMISGPRHSAIMAECAVLAWPGGPETVLLVLQALPADCPRLGLDPRLLDADKNFEIGVLAPWSEGAMPGEDRDMTVLFASRYLVAERE